MSLSPASCLLTSPFSPCLLREGWIPPAHTVCSCQLSVFLSSCTSSSLSPFGKAKAEDFQCSSKNLRMKINKLSGKKKVWPLVRGQHPRLQTAVMILGRLVGCSTLRCSPQVKLIVWSIRLLTAAAAAAFKLFRSRVRGPGDHDADGELQASRTSSQVSGRRSSSRFSLTHWHVQDKRDEEEFSDFFFFKPSFIYTNKKLCTFPLTPYHETIDNQINNNKQAIKEHYIFILYTIFISVGYR